VQRQNRVARVVLAFQKRGEVDAFGFRRKRAVLAADFGSKPGVAVVLLLDERDKLGKVIRLSRYRRIPVELIAKRAQAFADGLRAGLVLKKVRRLPLRPEGGDFCL
jgi:hypothetical protein